MNNDLYNAANLNNVKRVEELLKNGADPDYCHGYTILTLAARNANVEMCKLLVRHGANVDKKNGSDNYPIHLAVYANKIDVLSFLMEKGADVNVKDRHGETPLHRAIRNSYDDIVERLLASDKIDLEIRNNDCETCMDLILQNKEKMLMYFTLKKTNYEKIRKICDNAKEEYMKISKIKRDLEMDMIVKKIEEKQSEIAKLDIEINDLNERLTRVQTRRNQFEEERIELVKEQKDLQKENENKVESFSWVKNDYECPVCLAVPYAPKQIVQCTNGHSMCSHCKEKLEICPICQVDLGITVRNFWMEKMLAESGKTINS